MWLQDGMYLPMMQRYLVTSHLCARFEAKEFGRGYLLGDAGYPCKPYSLTPVTSLQTEVQHRYNFACIQSRNAVERMFQVVKRRFPCLCLELRTCMKVYCLINYQIVSASHAIGQHNSAASTVTFLLLLECDSE